MRILLTTLLRLILTIVEQVAKHSARQEQKRQQDEKQKARDISEADPALFFNTHFNGMRDSAKSNATDPNTLPADKTHSDGDTVR